MLGSLKSLFVLVMLFAASVTARRGCRQCSGTLSFTFNKPINKAVLDKMVYYQLVGCATGNEFRITGYSTPEGRCPGDTCDAWNVGLIAWRYCGNGGSVSHSLFTNTCTGGACATSNKLTMKCTKSVECGYQCEPNYC